MFTVTIADKGGKTIDVHQCRETVCTIGRSGKNRIVLQGWHLAPVHAELREEADGIHVRDLSGGPGTQVNGTDIEDYGPLQPTDIITLSTFRITVTDPHQQEQTTGKQKAPSTPPAGSAKQVDRQETPMQKAKEHQEPTHLAGSTSVPKQSERQRWHKIIHRRLMEAMDLRRTDVASLSDEQLTRLIQGLIREILEKLDAELPRDLDRKRLAREVLNEAVGLGPLEDLLADDTVSEIMVNNYDAIYVERHGRLEKTGVTFSAAEAVMSVIDRIVSPLGRRIDESSPMVDARLRDGSRVNAIIPPLAVHGPCLTIRKFSRRALTTDDLIGYGSISPPMVTFLQTAVRYRKNIIVSGGTGSGKTTFLNIISSFIPHSERIITVEDSAELQLEQPHVVSLEARPANVEGKGAVTIRDLVRNCLRMRPDRIIVGECRGSEALDMLQAMNTGHDGSLTTVHANSPRDLISRLEVMVMMAGMDLPDRAIREQVTSAVDIIVQQSRFADGSRKITHITEITGLEGDVVQMQNIFVFKQQGFDADGNVVGEFRSTGRIPEFYETLRARGVNTDLSIFGGP